MPTYQLSGIFLRVNNKLQTVYEDDREQYRLLIIYLKLQLALLKATALEQLPNLSAKEKYQLYEDVIYACFNANRRILLIALDQIKQLESIENKLDEAATDWLQDNANLIERLIAKEKELQDQLPKTLWAAILTWLREKPIMVAVTILNIGASLYLRSRDLVWQATSLSAAAIRGLLLTATGEQATEKLNQTKIDYEQAKASRRIPHPFGSTLAYLMTRLAGAAMESYYDDNRSMGQILFVYVAADATAIIAAFLTRKLTSNKTSIQIAAITTHLTTQIATSAGIEVYNRALRESAFQHKLLLFNPDITQITCNTPSRPLTEAWQIIFGSPHTREFEVSSGFYTGDGYCTYTIPATSFKFPGNSTVEMFPGEATNINCQLALAAR